MCSVLLCPIPGFAALCLKFMQDKKSKSAKKREHQGLQVLGERLIGLPETTLRDMPLGDSLVDAIIAASGITSHGALRRQRQLIGKLMKHVDPQPIHVALDALTQDSRQSKIEFKQAEAWRDKIVTGGQPLLEKFFEVTGSANRELESLLSDLDRAKTEKQRRTVQRNIFRQIHNDLNSQ